MSAVCDEHRLQPAVFHPQSNGKIARRHKSLKSECVRPTTPLSLQDVQRVAQRIVEVYNTERLHSAIGYMAPQDKPKGCEVIIFAERKRKGAEAREARAPAATASLRGISGASS